MAARHPETTLSRCGSFLSTTILACFSSFFLFYETAASQTHVSPRPTHLHPVEPDADGTLDVRFARHSRPQSDWRGRYSATKKNTDAFHVLLFKTKTQQHSGDHPTTCSTTGKSLNNPNLLNLPQKSGSSATCRTHLPDPSLNPVAKHLILLCYFKTYHSHDYVTFYAILSFRSVSDFSICWKIFAFLPDPLLARFLLLVGVLGRLRRQDRRPPQ